MVSETTTIVINSLKSLSIIFSGFSIICTALNIMKITHIFDMVKNLKTTEYGMNSIHGLSTGQYKRIQMYEWLWLKIVEASFPVILRNF